jgi:quercetin dioxygenase-like cupin family protein
MRPQAVATQMIDDARVRVTRFDFERGAQTGWHRHAMDYVITAVTECHMRLELPDGTINEVTVPAGTAYRRDKGVQHNVINAGDAPMSFIEVELK